MNAAPFRSRWLAYTPDASKHPADRTDKSASVGFGSDPPARVRGCGEPAAGSLSALLRRAGDLAAAINAHVLVCAVCRPEHFVTDNPAPLCPPGLELRRQYREARRAALVAWDGRK